MTFEAYLVRYRPSSKAASPPPTTATGRSRKNGPSQTAQYETPCPRKRIFSRDAEGAWSGAGGDNDGIAPEWSCRPRVRTSLGDFAKSTVHHLVADAHFGAELLRVLHHHQRELGTGRQLDSGIVLDLRGRGDLSTRHLTFEDQRGAHGARAVESGGQPGRPTTNDQHVPDRVSVTVVPCLHIFSVNAPAIGQSALEAECLDCLDPALRSVADCRA